MNYWLIKTEPTSYSIDDLKRDKKTSWTGIRNYQVRNLIRDEIKKGDLCLFYHSSAEPAGVYGVAKVISSAKPDPTALDRKDSHFDPKATKANPIWMCMGVAFVSKAKNPFALLEIKADHALDGMLVRKQGSRLSVQPVSKAHFLHIQKHL